MIKAAQYGLGIAFILIGIIGLFLPVIQGILFIIAGFLILRAHNLNTATKTLKNHIVNVRKAHKPKG